MENTGKAHSRPRYRVREDSRSPVMGLYRKKYSDIDLDIGTICECRRCRKPIVTYLDKRVLDFHTMRPHQCTRPEPLSTRRFGIQAHNA